MKHDEAMEIIKKLARLDPKMEYLSRNTNGKETRGNTSTDFWEQLYQAFAARMKAEATTPDQQQEDGK